jgi:hypothetical protein
VGGDLITYYLPPIFTLVLQARSTKYRVSCPTFFARDFAVYEEVLYDDSCEAPDFLENSK